MIGDSILNDLPRLLAGGIVLALNVFAACWAVPTMGVLLEAFHGL